MEPGNQATSTHSVALWIGVGLAALALFTPMDILGMNSMLTVHMTEHLLLSLAAPPLLIMGTPAWVFRRLFTGRRTRRGMKFLTQPVVASVLFNGNIWLWHAPLLMFLMMAQPALHLLSGLLYLITGLFFWWPLLSPLQEEGRPLSLGGKLAYLFFSDMPMMLLGAGLTFSQPLYSMPMGPHASMSISAGDQQLAGLLMWVVGGIFLYIVVGSTLFLRWMLAQERLEQEEEEVPLEQETENPIETPGPPEPSRLEAERSSA
jgi:cytochrome c oxidase assembly factor CtaG